MPSDAMPSTLRDEAIHRSDPLEREAQTIYLLCLSHDKMHRHADHEKFIEELAGRLKRLIEKPPPIWVYK
jgi:hypothetical protein